MNGKSAGEAALANGLTTTPACRVRLSLGQKLALFFTVFMAATYANTHLAFTLFDSLGSSAYVVNETGRLRYLSQKIAYLATRDDSGEHAALDEQIAVYNRILGDIEAHLHGEGRALLESNPLLQDMLDKLRSRWQGYAGAVARLTASNPDSPDRQLALAYLHDTAEEMLAHADHIVNTLTEADAEIRRRMHRQMDGAMLLEVIFLLAVFLMMQHGVSRPLRQLNTLCQRFAAGEHSARMRFSSCDEVGELSRSFNRTAEVTAALIRDLNERTREATLLHRVAVILQENITIEEAIERVIKLLPEGWQYPEVTVARITLGDICRRSPDFRETPWRMTTEFASDDGTPGRLEVAYREERPVATEGPFLAEERQVLDDVAGMLKSFIDRIGAQHAQTRLFSIFESTNDLVGSFDPDGRIFYLNEAGRRLFTGDAPGTDLSIDAIYAPWALTLHRRLALPTAARQGSWKGEVALRAADGRELMVSLMLVAHHAADGTLSHYSFIARDISDRIEMEQRLTRSRDFYLSLFHDFPDLIWRADRAGHADYFNHNWLEFTGKQLLAQKGQQWMDSLHPEDREQFRVLVESALGGGENFEIEYRLRHSSGEYRWMRGHCRPYRDIEGNFAGLICSSHDITDRKRIAEELAQLANYDSLTGLPNRALLKDRVEQAIVFARRLGHQVAVMFIDLDRFKNVNDTLGHDIGDRLLTIVARRLRDCLREGDTVARIGGDEFVVVLPDVSDESDWRGVAEKLLDALRAPCLINDHELYVTGSLGIALYPGDGDDCPTLLKHADIAMYRAKEDGHGYRYYAKEMDDHMQRRLTLESQLRRAVERNEFVLHYQPQMDVASGRIVGLEALVRWENPELGLVPPSDFIPLAEETGLIVPIGAWVLHAACAQNLAWQTAGFAPVRVAVNLSARQFRQQDVVRLVAGALAATGLDGSHLDIELTESMLVQDPERIIDTLHRLKALNVRIALDDFGTGYSSLAYLKRFPIDEIKIDRSFVRDVSSNAEDAAIVQAIMGIARSLNLSVVAEGVETAEQLHYLRNCDCERIQGYLISRPVPAERVPALLAAAPALPVRA